MQDSVMARVTAKYLPFAICMGGVFYTASETVLKLLGTSICGSQGCNVVSSFARYGDVPVLFMGVSFFVVMAAFTLLVASGREDLGVRFFGRQVRINLHMAVMVMIMAACAAEGYLVGFQLYSAAAICSYCMGMLALVIVTMVTYAFVHGRLVILSGVLTFCAVLVVTSLINPVGRAVNLDEVSVEKITRGKPGHTYYLIYGADCRHCEKVIDYCRKNLNDDFCVALCPMERCGAVLESLNVREVPVLLADRGRRKEIITGEGEILNYLGYREPLDTFLLSTPMVRALSGHADTCAAGRVCAE